MSLSRIEMQNIAHQRESSSAKTTDDYSINEIVDIAVLLSFEEVQAEDEPDLITELIDLYLSDTAHQMALMQKAVAEADVYALKRTAHSLKGSNANLGIKRMTALCGELEHVDRGDSLQQANLLLTKIFAEFECVREILMAERQRRSEK
jgi:histidine phosphotransfer protein HptB